jgi:gluconolactonase
MKNRLFLSMLLSLGAISIAQDFNMLEVETLTGRGASSKYKYLEGPLWISDPAAFYFSDTPANEVWQIIPNKKSTVFRSGLKGPAGLAADKENRIYVCESRARRVVRLEENGDLKEIATEFEGKKLNAPNDIVVRRDGQVYFTDPAFASAKTTRELDFYGVFHVNPKGEIKAIARLQTRPNGLALSADGKRLLVADADTRAIYSFDLDKSGKATPQKTWLAKVGGIPGGLAMDVSGNVYVAAGKLFIYNSEGKLLREMDLPDRAINCAFGSPDWQVLFVTTRNAIYAVRMPVKGTANN